MTTKQKLNQLNKTRKAICNAKYYIEQVDRNLYRELDTLSERLAGYAVVLENDIKGKMTYAEERYSR